MAAHTFTLEHIFSETVMTFSIEAESHEEAEQILDIKHASMVKDSPANWLDIHSKCEDPNCTFVAQRNPLYA